MAGASSPQDLTNRVSQFPRSGTKRTVEHLEKVVQGTSQSVQRLKKSQTPLSSSTSFSKEPKSPWQYYQKTFKLNQAGYGLVVQAKNATFAEGVMKEIQNAGKESLTKVKSYSHGNLVEMQRVYYDDVAIYLLYEIMDVSLAQIFTSPLGRLQSYEVAAFTQEVLTGLDYIHRVLKIAHGNITSDSILLSTSGAVKIANVGDAMLQRDNQKEKQDDLKAVGTMIRECLDPAIFSQKEYHFKPKSWESDVVDFVESTDHKSAQRLLQHDFLKLSPGSSCLKPYIRLAREVGAKEVEMVKE